MKHNSIQKHQKKWKLIISFLIVFTSCVTDDNADIPIIHLPNGHFIENPNVENFNSYNLVLTELGYVCDSSLLPNCLDRRFRIISETESEFYSSLDGDIDDYYKSTDKVTGLVFDVNCRINELKGELEKKLDVTHEYKIFTSSNSDEEHLCYGTSEEDCLIHTSRKNNGYYELRCKLTD